MPGGYHRGGGSDRGRKRPPMHSIHGGHVTKAPRFAHSNQFRGRGRGSPGRGGPNRRGFSGGSHAAFDRRSLPSPHRRDIPRRTPQASPPSHDYHYPSSGHNQSRHRDERRDNFEFRHERGERSMDYQHRRDSRDRDRDRSFQRPDRRRSFSNENRRSPTSRREERSIDSRDRSRPNPPRSPIPDSPVRARDEAPRHYKSVSDAQAVDAKVDAVSLSSSLPKPVGSALQRSASGTQIDNDLNRSPRPSRHERDDIPSRHQSSNKVQEPEESRRRSNDERDSVASPLPLMSVDTSQRSVTSSTSRSRSNPYPQSKEAGFSKGPRNSGKPQRRESVLNRLGPKMKLSQRLGRPNRPSASNGRGDNEDDASFEESGSSDAKADGVKKKFLRLQCPHCNVKTPTFKSYVHHLRSDTHLKSMRFLTPKLRSHLSRLRAQQRREQKDIEDKMAEDGKDIGPDGNKLPSLYCKTCKLMYHQEKSVHEESDLHSTICRFLLPKCSVCSSQFSSPIAYEKHIATINHIKRKSLLADRNRENEDGDSAERSELNESDFLTLDEVGEVDDEELGENDNDDVSDVDNVDDLDEKDETKNDENATTIDEKASKKEADTLEPAKAKDESDRPVKKRKLAEEPANPIVKKKKKSTPMKSEPGLGKTEPEKLVEIDTTKPVGENFVRKVEMFYCDLCHKYLPRTSVKDDVDPSGASLALVTSHCLSSSHQAAFVKKREEELAEEQRALDELAAQATENADEKTGDADANQNENIPNNVTDVANVANDKGGHNDEVTGDDDDRLSINADDEQLDYDGEMN